MLTEADKPGDDFLARLTVEWEASTAPVALLGVRHVSIRSGVVLSPTEGALYRLLLPFKLFAGGPMGSGRQGFSWIHPIDETAAIRFLIENSAASGAFNLCAPEPLTNAEFAKVIGAVLGRPSWLPAPAFALKLALARSRPWCWRGNGRRRRNCWTWASSSASPTLSPRYGICSGNRTRVTRGHGDAATRGRASRARSGPCVAQDMMERV